MSSQKIFGLLVDDQKSPIIEKPGEAEQCYICGFSFDSTDECVFIFTDKELSERKKIHKKCLQSHLVLMPQDTKIALISEDTNEILSYTSAHA
ncbi:MAG: hypothetical protein GF308_17125 [Candidatus Heimdallarchaeota archaeon]|nr:hypothetical protein [Candidatus Heimdallarchaeota archaeon]